MKEIKFSDTYVIFSPKKGIKKYFTFSFYASVILCVCFIIVTFIFKDEPLRSFYILPIGISEMLFWIAEIINTGSKLSLATDSFSLAKFLKTTPNIKENLKKALICEEIRKTTLCFCYNLVLMLIIFIFDIYPIKKIILCFFCMNASMNLAVTIGEYFIKRVKNLTMPVNITILYCILAISSILVAFSAAVLTEEYTGYTALIVNIFTGLINLLSLIFGTVCFCEVKNRAMGGIIND